MIHPLILFFKIHLSILPFMGLYLLFSQRWQPGAALRIHRALLLILMSLTLAIIFLPLPGLFLSGKAGNPGLVPVEAVFGEVLSTGSAGPLAPVKNSPGWLALLPLLLMLPGGIIFGVWLTRQIVYERKLIKNAVRQRRPGNCLVIYSREVKLPFSSGVVRKKIFLPAELTSREHRIFLTHEGIHLRSGDLFWTLIEKMLAGIFPWNPLLVLYARRGEELRELFCDQEAARRLGWLNYADCLLKTAESAVGIKPPLLAVGMKGNSRGFLIKRVESLMNKKGKQPSPLIFPILLFLAALSFVVFQGVIFPTGTLYAAPQEVEQTGEQPVTEERLILHWPLAGGLGQISRGFGPSLNPFTQEPMYHRGIDIAGRNNTSILASAGGVVLDTGFDTDRGYWVSLGHGGSYITSYTHLSPGILVKKGDNIEQGKQIGFLGNSGLSTGPHVHLELSENEIFVNPLLFMADIPGEVIKTINK